MNVRIVRAVRIVPSFALAVLTFACSQHHGDFTLVNNAVEPIAHAVVAICGQTFDLRDIDASGRAARQFDVTCHGQYDVQIEFSSGRKLEKVAGEVIAGADFRHAISVTRDRIAVTPMP